MATRFYPDSIKVVAFPNGKYTNISTDSLDARLHWGIRGVEPTDILADVGNARLTLTNMNGLYYPDGSSGIAGWTSNTIIKIIVTYGGVPYVRFRGYLDIDSLVVGKIPAENKVSLTVNDWMLLATRTPILEPDVQLSKTADEGIELVLAYCPIQPNSTSLETGDYTFPVIFDSIGVRTKAYTEFSKFAYSESPGHIYLKKDIFGGETLVFENSTHRDSSHALSTTFTYTSGYKFLNQAGDNWKNHSGGVFLNHSVDTQFPGGTTDIELSDTHIDAVEIDYGKNIINRAVVTAYPKRIDDDVQVLYELDYPMAIANGETIVYRAPYTDPSGGRQINALVSSMVDPVAPGQADPYRKLLCHFTSDTTDSTGNHTVTANDVTIETDNYIDVGPDPDVQRVSGSILGPYALFGGYADYNLSVASSSDFEFGSGAFTIGFYAVIMNPSSAGAIIARDGTTSFVPWMIGSVDGTNVEIYMSSDGASWDIANGESLGQVQLNRWVHYEVSRDDDGWFYAFVDGNLTSKWYSSASFPANSNALSIGKSQGANYIFMALDELFIDKGRILHKKDFTPPKKNLSENYEGDYWLNTADDESGTDYSSNLLVLAYYGSEAVTYRVTNNSGVAGYFYVRARGRGIYAYSPIEDAVQDDITNIQKYGYKEAGIQQKYQQNLIAGTAWATDIVDDQKVPKTRLKSVSFFANKSDFLMDCFLQADVGYLVRVTLTDPNIDGYYYIQNVKIIYVTWGLKEGLTPA